MPRECRKKPGRRVWSGVVGSLCAMAWALAPVRGADAASRTFSADTVIAADQELVGGPGGVVTEWNIPRGVTVTLDSAQGGQLLTATRRGGPEQLGPAILTVSGGGVLYSRTAREFGIRLGHAIGRDGSYYGGSAALHIRDGATARFDTELAVYPTGGTIHLEGEASALEFLTMVPAKLDEAAGELVVRKLYGSNGRIPLRVNGEPLRLTGDARNASFTVVRVNGVIYQQVRALPRQASSATQRELNFRGWAGCREWRDRFLCAVFAPELGKMMALAPAGEENLLWVNPALAGLTLGQASAKEPLFGWANFGGERFWAVPQADNAQVRGGKTWPADETFDGKPWRCDFPAAGRMTMRSGVSPESGVGALRTITLADYPGTILFDQTLTAVPGRRKSPLNLIQNVTAVRRPDLVIARLPQRSHFRADSALPEGVASQTFPKEEKTAEFLQARDGFLFLRYPREGFTGKAYLDLRDGWLCAVYGNTLFFQCFRYQPDAYYADGGCSAEVYVSHYYELELLSPARMLRPEESLRFPMVWHIAQRNLQGMPPLAVALQCEEEVAALLRAEEIRNFLAGPAASAATAAAKRP